MVIIMERTSRDAVVVAYGRAPLTRARKGSFAQTHPIEYGAQTLAGVLKQLPGLDPAAIDDVVVGCAYPERYTGFNVARLLVQRAGLPDTVTAQTINRFCSSGLQSIAIATNAIKAGAMDIVAAGGVERMTDINMYLPEEYQDAALSAQIPASYIAMGLTAENVAEQCGITRQEMEAMAVDSHRKAAAAQQAGKFEDEIIPIQVETGQGPVTVKLDEGIRPETTAGSLAQLKPCFKEDGVVTAATSSQMTDGAAFVVLMARETAEKLGYRPIARLIAFEVGGVPAAVMGLGPIVAVPKALKRAGLSMEDLDVIELNEAFASQALACIRELGMPEEKVNPNGGAMALGHPLGATGSVLTCKLLPELKRTNGRYGMVTMCIGGGMGAAGIYEME